MTMPSPPTSERIPISSAEDIVRARCAARNLANRVGFSVADQTRLATAVSELTRNVLQYAGEGFCEIFCLAGDAETLVRVLVEDHGPGIENIDRAFQDGYSTSGGLGKGLPGTRRLVDDLSIQSQPGLTSVHISMRRKSA